MHEPMEDRPSQPARSALTRMQRIFCWVLVLGGLLTILGAVFGDISAPSAVTQPDGGSFAEALKAMHREQQMLHASMPRWLLLAFGAATSFFAFFGLRGRQWAFWALVVLFLPQCFEYVSNQFTYSLIGPWWSFTVGWGWISPPRRFNINILAVVICFFAAGTALSLRERKVEEGESAARIEPSF